MNVFQNRFAIRFSYMTIFTVNDICEPDGINKKVPLLPVLLKRKIILIILTSKQPQFHCVKITAFFTFAPRT